MEQSTTINYQCNCIEDPFDQKKSNKLKKDQRSNGKEKKTNKKHKR